MATVVRLADALRSLRRTPANTFHGMLSDPPYGLSFMGKAWDASVPPTELWAECFRVLRPGAYALVFGGTRTFHRLACALEDAGFEIRDCLCWMYGSGFPKNHDVGKSLDGDVGVKGRRGAMKLGAEGRKGGVGLRGNHYVTDDHHYIAGTRAGRAWRGYGTALKPAWEPILLVRKPLDGTVARNVRLWGTGAIAIDPCRIGVSGGGTHCSNRDAAGKCRGHRNAGRSTSGETFHGPETAGRRLVVSRPNGIHGNALGVTLNGSRAMGTTSVGRFPANVLLDDDAARVLDAEVGTLHGAGAARTGSKNPRRRAEDLRAVTNAPVQDTGNMHRFGDEGGPSRFFYTAKVSQKERNGGVRGGCKHPTLKPIALTTYLARLLLPPDPAARLLVPFSGAGSEMIGAKRAGWRHVTGIEQDARSVKDARARLAHHLRKVA